MQAVVSINGKNYTINLAEPLNISIPAKHGTDNPNAFYVSPIDYSPVRTDSFVGSTLEGGLLNFKDIRINPHGNGTHTECVGHISKDGETINTTLKNYFHLAQVVSIYPQKQENGDLVITKEQVQDFKKDENINSLIIRTLPNDDSKITRQYSGANPPYVHHTAIECLVQSGIEHLLLDLPSVDREEDEGKLLAHKAFWQYPNNTRKQATITEMIFVPNNIDDGLFLLNIMIPNIEMDAAMSMPILYRLKD